MTTISDKDRPGQTVREDDTLVRELAADLHEVRTMFAAAMRKNNAQSAELRRLRWVTQRVREIALARHQEAARIFGADSADIAAAQLAGEVLRALDATEPLTLDGEEGDRG